LAKETYQILYNIENNILLAVFLTHILAMQQYDTIVLEAYYSPKVKKKLAYCLVDCQPTGAQKMTDHLVFVLSKSFSSKQGYRFEFHAFRFCLSLIIAEERGEFMVLKNLKKNNPIISRVIL
jgi:hypothetical protein